MKDELQKTKVPGKTGHKDQWPGSNIHLPVEQRVVTKEIEGRIAMYYDKAIAVQLSAKLGEGGLSEK